MPKQCTPAVGSLYQEVGNGAQRDFIWLSSLGFFAVTILLYLLFAARDFYSNSVFSVDGIALGAHAKDLPQPISKERVQSRGQTAFYLWHYKSMTTLMFGATSVIGIKGSVLRRLRSDADTSENDKIVLRIGDRLDSSTSGRARVEGRDGFLLLPCTHFLYLKKGPYIDKVRTEARIALKQENGVVEAIVLYDPAYSDLYFNLPVGQ